MNADRASDRRRLLATLTDLAESGRPIPCRTVSPTKVALFVSDEPMDQEFAARLCVDCAGANRCRTYGLTYPKETGVYWGMTDAERRDPVARRGNAGVGVSQSPPPWASSPTG